MARSDSTSAPSLGTSQLDQQPSPLFQPFSWLDSDLKSDHQAQFAALAMDISNGVQTCLQLIHHDSLTRTHNRCADPGQEEASLLGEADTERLLLLATAAVKILSERAEGQIEMMRRRVQNQAASGAKS